MIQIQNKIFGALILLLMLSCESSENEYTTEIVMVQNDSIQLAANIYKPKGEGPFPAVVLVHGSKNHTMDYYTEYSEYFASHGIVTVNYDKRGFGLSSGSLYKSTFTDLAKDANSIVNYLENQSYVDKNRIGLWADSQAGWVVLIADNLTNHIAFIINKAGPVMTPLKQILYDYKVNYMIPNDTPDDVIDELGIWYEDVFKYLIRSRSDSLWNKINTVINKYENTPYLKASFDEYYLSILKAPDKIEPIDEVILDPGGRTYDFDPIPYMKKFKTPMLYVIGTADNLNNTAECINNIKDINNPIITLKVYEGADHGIRVQKQPKIFFKPDFPSDYLKLQEEFIKTSNQKTN